LILALALPLWAAPGLARAQTTGSVGAVVGLAWQDGAQVGRREAAWSGGLRADAEVARAGLGRLRAELATAHGGTSRSTDTVSVDLDQHALLLLASAGLRTAGFEPYVSGGPSLWLIRSRYAVATDSSTLHALKLGLGGLAGVRGRWGRWVPRVEGGLLARPGRSWWFAGLGVSYVWGTPRGGERGGAPD